MLKLHEVIAELDRWFPRFLAEDWDNVGLLVGDRQAAVEKVMTCLTVTPESAGEAIRENADLIVSHHPVLFRPTKRLTADGDNGFLYRLVRAGVAIYSPHTAFDGAEAGINEQIGALLGLQETRPLKPAAGPRMLKVVVFSPESDLEAVQTAMFAAGGGVIGEYSECSYRLLGTGTFKGSDASNPTIGQRGQSEEVAEHRLEVLASEDRLAAVIAAMRHAHSYEEPAYDVYSLHPVPRNVGAGRIGMLSGEKSVSQVALTLKEALGLSAVEWIGKTDAKCGKVAVACGAGGGFLRDAAAAGCDVIVTGEARFHDYLEARARGIGMVLLGHYASERFAVETLADRIAKKWPDADVWASRDESDPVNLIADGEQPF